jgi:hypothetical protein
VLKKQLSEMTDKDVQGRRSRSEARPMKKPKRPKEFRQRRDRRGFGGWEDVAVSIEEDIN